MIARRPRLSIALFLSGLSVLAFGGCTGGLLDTQFDVPTTYVLAPLQADNPSSSPAMADLTVGVPVPAPGLDTERIVTLHDSRRLDFYRDARWGATAANVLQALVVASLQNQNLFRSVTPEQARVSATHLLDMQLRDFQADYSDSGVPTVKVTLVATVVRLKDRKLLASFPATASVEAKANHLNDVVAAFEAASQQAITTLSRQTADVINNAAP